MPKLGKIIDILENHIPQNLMEVWDNVGLIIGNRENEINKAIVALDCTENVIDEAIINKCNLIITHHPLIFDSIKNIDYATPLGRKISKLIKNDISLVAMHTNFDKIDGGTSDTLANMLELKNIENLTDDEYSLGKIGEIFPTSLKEFASFVKEKLNLKSIKYVGNDDLIIKKVSVVSGAGSDFYIDAKNKGADCLITSEIKHHIAIDAMESNLALIDGGHYETEAVSLTTFCDILKDYVDINVAKSYKELFKIV